MRRPSSALLVVALLVTTTEARASNDGLDHIDFDTELVVRMELPQLAAVLERAGSWNVANGVGVGLLRSALESALGFDPATMSAWRARGFNPADPVWVSLALDTPALEDRYERLLRSDDWSAARLAKAPPGFWHARIVFAVTDSNAALTWIKSKTAGARWQKLPGKLRHGASRSYAHHPVSALWLFIDSPRPDILVLDVIRPVFGASLSAPPLATIVGAARPVRKRDRFGALKGGRAAATLRQRGVSLWIRSRTISTIGRALAREAHVSEVAGRPKLRAYGPMKSHPQCVDLGRVAILGPFEDLALRAHVTTGAPLSLEVAFGGDPALLARTFARADHQLDAHRRAGTVAWMSMWNRGPAGVRALPRNKALQSWPEALRLLRQCSPQHAISARVFGWPELSGLFFDELAALGPRGKAIADRVAGASGSIATWAADPMQMTAILEGTLVDTLTSTVERALTSVFGVSREAGSSRRWGRGRVRPYLHNGRVGVTLGGAVGERWRARSKQRPPVAWLSGNELAAAWVDLSRSTGALTRWESSLMALEGAGELRVRLFVSGDRVVLESRITQQ